MSAERWANAALALLGEPQMRDHARMAFTAADDADESLMLRYAAGETAAFSALYERHKAGLWRYLLHQSRNEAVTAELFQDVWANLIRAKAGYEPRAKFSTWLYRLAHNRLVDHWRALRPNDALDEAAEEVPASAYLGPEARSTQAEQGSRIVQALKNLAPEQREAFLLQAEGGLSLEEIAATQGVGRETAKSRLRYALAKLRGELADVWV